MIFNLSLLLIILLLYFFTHLKNSYSKQKKDYLFLRITFIIFFILVSFRAFNIGNDTLTYLNFFEKCAKYKWEIVSFDGYYEGGYIILNILISYISLHPRFFLIVMSLRRPVVLPRFVRKVRCPWLPTSILTTSWPLPPPRAARPRSVSIPATSAGKTGSGPLWMSVRKKRSPSASV